MKGNMKEEREGQGEGGRKKCGSECSVLWLGAYMMTKKDTDALLQEREKGVVEGGRVRRLRGRHGDAREKHDRS